MLKSLKDGSKEYIYFLGFRSLHRTCVINSPGSVHLLFLYNVHV